MKRIILNSVMGFIFALSLWAQDSSVKLEFSGKTAEENQVTLQGAGFGQYPQADVQFGYIPTDNAFEGATDGQGAIVQAEPGEGVMLIGPNISWDEAAHVRCSVYTEGKAKITLAVIGSEPDRFVSTHSPASPTYCQGKYQRLSAFATPPGTGFQPVLQIVNAGAETLLAYVDNLNTYQISKTMGYHGEFMNGDETDPAEDKITISADGSHTVVKKNDRNPSIQPSGLTVDQSLKLDFNGASAIANQVSILGAGFDAYPQADVAFTALPTDNAFANATDGQGIKIEAQPGQGVMLVAPEITNLDAAMIRCSVRTEGGDANVSIAALGTGIDPCTSVTYAANPDCFAGQYRRICAFATPPSEKFQPLLQIMNNSQTEPLIAYVDNLEVVILDRFHYYWGEFLNGDETDPVNGQIGVEAEEGANAWALYDMEGVWRSNDEQFKEIVIERDWNTNVYTCKVLMGENYYNTNIVFELEERDWESTVLACFFINNELWTFKAMSVGYGVTSTDVVVSRYQMGWPNLTRTITFTK